MGSSTPASQDSGTAADAAPYDETHLDGSELQPLGREETKASYSYTNIQGWRRWRALRPGRGIYHDIVRRLPYYWSDITDAWTYRIIASTIRMYFVNLLPAIAYTLDMYRRTGEFFGINEALFSSALAAIVFSVLGCQPLTIVGVTGLISLFNFTIYDIISIYDVSIYPQFMAWTGIWAAIFHWLVAVLNGCDYMRYVTDFSSESFGMYVGIIYIIKGVEELVNEFDEYGSTAGYLACMIAILYFASVYSLEKLGSGKIWKAGFRGFLADYAYVVRVRLSLQSRLLPDKIQFCTIFWVGFSHIPGRIELAHVGRLPVTKAFAPTQPRSWLIDFWNLDIGWVFVAMPFGFLVMLLFYYDHNVSSITAQARQFPLKKPGGFHWDFFLLGCTTFASGILGLPLPNGLVPQAPVHTDSLTVYKTGLRIIPTTEGEGTEIRRPVVTAEAVVEQRISHFLMGLALIGTMTGPLLVLLHIMPTAVFAGVFFVVGWGSIESNGILQKFIYLQAEERFVQRDEPLLQVRKRKIWLYIAIQFSTVAACVAISHTLAAIGFPVIIMLLIPLRILIVPKWFKLKELQVLDDFTATNKIVLASLGGKPALPEHSTEEEWGLERRRSERRFGVPRQRAGSLHR
ncbi:Boron transporter 1 [Madurella mycetomatis]|uniref:Boron transporter 1 n=1 Tax=Madurella mycetomatis TaxID=100816 RepID=A0A175WEM5_9PEZI|nr:Boron transporter 1 [Madurella mycetomatis]KXX82106.1 Boron transporter 1 [Madurella mycetomatis]